MGESRTTRWGDWQRVRLQENENEVPAGSMPRSMDVIVRDEMCERAKPGDKVLVTGCLIVVPEVPSLMSPSELKQTVRRSINTRTDGAGDGVRGLKGLGNRDLNYKLAFFGGFVDEDGGFGAGGTEKGESVRRMTRSTFRNRRRIAFCKFQNTKAQEDVIALMCSVALLLQRFTDTRM